MLKNRETDKELFVVSIQLLPTEEAKEKHGVEEPEEKLAEVHGQKPESAKPSDGGADDDLD